MYGIEEIKQMNKETVKTARSAKLQPFLITCEEDKEEIEGKIVELKKVYGREK